MGAEGFRVVEYSKRTVYHSPQTPGYTCWVGLWNMPDGSTMMSFTQATGPLEGRPKAPPDIRERLTWPPVIAGEFAGQRESYDMTGLDLANVHLHTTDGGSTWMQVSADGFHTCMNGVTGAEETALSDGTILRGVWGWYLPYDDVPQTGYIQRSTDGSKSWGKPQIIIDPRDGLFWPKRIRALRDRRVIMTGAMTDSSSPPRTRIELSRTLRPILLVSEDNGQSWGKPIEVLPETLRRPPYPGEEYDAAELPNGDLLLVFRWAAYDPATGKLLREERRQSVLKKARGGAWQCGLVRPAPFPHSGHPELLATREGVVLHVATSAISWTGDIGRRWHDLDIEGSGYYPRSVQLPDGRILCAYHHGGDDGYGDRDQSIGMCIFRLAPE